ncbi:MAG: TIGR00730 family Rossman fold protein [Sphingobium sp.]
MTSFRRIAVYCGAATPADPLFIQTAQEVGRELARWGIGIIYGGGHLGLMGALADAALAAGGEVIGVIPEALVHAEAAHRGLSKLHVVPDMHSRKALFTSLSDGFLTLPGGVGTMDELWEAISWAQLGYHAKPVGLLNVGGFYDQLIGFHRHMIETGFIRPGHAGILITRDTLPPLLDAMDRYEAHDSLFAAAARDGAIRP